MTGSGRRSVAQVDVAKVDLSVHDVVVVLDLVILVRSCETLKMNLNHNKVTVN